MKARPHPRIDGLTLTSIGPDDVDKIMGNLKNSKSSGLDNIDTYILKLIRPYIVPTVTHIVNTSITTLTFPEVFKEAKVVPLYKGKNSSATDPKSYRPIALLPILSKIIDRVLCSQIVNFMDSNQF